MFQISDFVKLSMDIRDPVGTNITNIWDQRSLFHFYMLRQARPWPQSCCLRGAELMGTGKCSDGRAGQMGMGMETMAYD